MNKPTAIFFAVVHYMYDGDKDAIGVAYDLVKSTGFTGFGRARRWAALKKVAPQLAEQLEKNSVDIIYIDTENPEATYRAVAREIRRAEKWLDENGAVPAVCVYLGTPKTYQDFWPDGWRYYIWAVANAARIDDIDAMPLPLPRDMREALME